jgi:hypothetical protein
VATDGALHACRMRAALPSHKRALRVRLHRTVVAPGTLPDPTRPVEDGRKAAASGGGICIAQPTLCQPSKRYYRLRPVVLWDSQPAQTPGRMIGWRRVARQLVPGASVQIKPVKLSYY